MADATPTPMTEEAQHPPMKAFRMLPNTGTTFLWGRFIEPGEIVLLTENQGRAFGDRFVPVDDSPFRVHTTAETAKLSKKLVPVEVTKEPAVAISPATGPVASGTS